MVLPLVGEYVAAFFEPLHNLEGVFLFIYFNNNFSISKDGCFKEFRCNDLDIKKVLKLDIELTVF